MKRIIFSCVLAAVLVGCGSGTTSSSLQTTNTQTYGGVNQPASYAWNFQNSTNSTTGIIRLVNNQSGIVFITSNKDSLTFALKGAVSNFALNESQCLSQTALSGSINDDSSNASITLTNCVFNSNQLTALVTIIANQETLYSGTESFNTIEIFGTESTTELSNALAQSDPVLYNHNSNVLANMVITLNGFDGLFGSYSGSGGMLGELFGNLVHCLVSGESSTFSLPRDIDMQMTSSMIDSTSLNVDLNLTNSGYSTQVKCNVLLSGLVVDNSLNSSFNGFVTGCSGDIPSSIGSITPVNVSGNLNIQ